MVNTSYSNTTTQILKVKTDQVAYRQLGDVKNLPLLCLNHLAATLDNFDPAMMDGWQNISMSLELIMLASVSLLASHVLQLSKWQTT